MRQLDLIEPAVPTMPEGFVYVPDFLTHEEESSLLETLRSLPFEQAQYHEWTARRRIVTYGGRYDFTDHALGEAPPVPSFLEALRARVGEWARIPAGELTYALVAEYSPGTPLGWHRDVPEFERIVGVSLAGHARMRFRPYPPATGERTTHAIDLAPRSAYSIQGPARWAWQHAISPTAELRYSITFRTLRR